MADSANPPDATSGGDRKQILVVTDEARLEAELTDAFPSDYDVAIARDAREALEYLRSNRAAVLVVDLQTGSSGGFGLLKEIQQDNRISPAPAVMILDRRQDQWLAKQAGARVILTKPAPAERVVAGALSLLNA